MLIKKILYFLDSKDKKSLIVLLLLAIVIGFIELLGVASIVPFIGLLNEPDYLAGNKYFISVNAYFSIDSDSLVYVSGIFMVSMFILMNFLNAYNLWKTTYYGAILNHKITLATSKNYFSQPYEFFVNTDIPSVSKNILEEAGSLAESIFIPLMQIISRLIVLTFISVLLITINVEVFIFSLVIFGVIYLVLFRTIKNKVRSYGTKRLEANSSRFKNINDCLGSIKDVKFYNAERYYLENFSKSQKDFLDLTAKAIILSTLPRYIIEIISFGGFFSVILYLKYIDADLATHLPIISLFILAAYRLLPSLNQIYVLSSHLRFHIPALDIIYQSLVKRDNSDFSPNIKEMKSLIKFNDVSFSYNADKPVLKDINFEINASTISAIVGETGVGKTTLLDLLLGFYKPTSGHISVNINLINSNTNRLKIGYVSQKISFVDDSILKNIAFGSLGDTINSDYAEKIINTVMLKGLINKLPNKIHEKIGEDGVKLSGGQLQRIGIARALYLNPKILVLDEATNALDVETEKLLFDSIRKEYNDITIIWITHRSSSLSLCDNIYRLSNHGISLLDDYENSSVNELKKGDVK